MIIYAKKKKDLLDRAETLVKIKECLKDDNIVKEICNEHEFDQDILDGISISFSDELDVSAKTTDSKIELNSSLLEDDFNIIMRYVIHELVHAIQHLEAKTFNDPYEDHDYLDRPDELEAFTRQIQFDKENRGEEKVEKYVNDLIEYHEIPLKEQKQKKKELLNMDK